MAVLRAVYSDLSRIADHVAEDVVLHAAERGLDETTTVCAGKQAVLDKELGLIRATGGTLVMDVESITANDYFGAVSGTLRARLGGEDLGIPFCGLWKFRAGLIVEHWENAYDVAEFAAFLARHS
ncbi:nuclear transport factor 2 family protein [Nocardia tengchongensis]